MWCDSKFTIFLLVNTLLTTLLLIFYYIGLTFIFNEYVSFGLSTIFMLFDIIRKCMGHNLIGL